MARGRGGSRPTHYIAVTAKVGKGKYEKGPYIGLWEGDDSNGPLFRGSVSGKYLDELADFIKDFGEDNVGFAIFESRGDKGGRGRGRDRDRDDDRERDRDEDRNRSRRSSRDEDEPRGRGKRSSKDDEKEDRGSSRRSSSRGSSRDKGDKWWDDE